MSPLNPDEILSQWTGVKDSNFSNTIQQTFGLPGNDSTVYEAEDFSMTLSKIQAQIDTGKYKWQYRSHGQLIQVLLPHLYSSPQAKLGMAIEIQNSSLTYFQIPEPDITAYISIFSPFTSSSSALKSFDANARKGSPRASVASYLISRRILPDTIKIPKLKHKPSPISSSLSAYPTQHINPYLDIWTWACYETRFLGPLNDTAYSDPAAARHTHPMLPVLYHHFGCLCPSFEALTIIAEVVKQQNQDGIIEIGSGNGYWAFLLRRLGVSVVTVDSLDAAWRTLWISDTVKADGVEFLRRKESDGGKGRALLLVYPVVGGDFTRRVIQAYKGDTVVIAGTQNANRFTGLKDMTAEEYFENEKKDFELRIRIALPSFAGKDEGLFVWQRKRKGA